MSQLNEEFNALFIGLKDGYYMLPHANLWTCEEKRCIADCGVIDIKDKIKLSCSYFSEVGSFYLRSILSCSMFKCTFKGQSHIPSILSGVF